MFKLICIVSKKRQIKCKSDYFNQKIGNRTILAASWEKNNNTVDCGGRGSAKSETSCVFIDRVVIQVQFCLCYFKPQIWQLEVLIDFKSCLNN